MPDTSRRRPHWLHPVFGIAMLAAAACGGDDDGNGSPTDPPGADTVVTTSLTDGGPFTAVAANINVIQGRVFIVATNGANETLGLSFELQIGVQRSGTAGNASASYARLGQGGGSWAAGSNLAASSGTITLTTATANRIVGSFDITLVGSGNSTPATLRFTNGRLDISY